MADSVAAVGAVLAPGVAEVHVERATLHELRALGQVERKFIAATAARTLYLLDQHAADERVQFEKLQHDYTLDDGD